jgi:predicted ABC-type exoprotein transport system permease subunit
VKGGALVLLVWSLLLAIHVPVMAAIFNENSTSVLLLGGAASATALVAIGLWLRRRRAEGEDPDVERPVTEVSMASALIGVALALMLLGAQFGLWLVMIGAGLLELGLAGVARELRAERRVARR